MKVSEIGEFGLIDALAGLVGAEERRGEAWKNLVVGIGDDAAAWQAEPGIELATVDALVQDVHFKLGMTSWEELGWRSLAVNLSDIAAMGGLPRYALVSLTLPEDTEVSDIASFYEGMLDLARQFEVAVIGGNVSRSPILTINIAVLGSADGTAHRLLTRSSAEAGDMVAVTGYPGSAAAGLDILARGIAPDAELAAGLKRAFLKPLPRVVEGRMLLRGGVRAAVDISDGIVSDLGHICRASRLGAIIRADRLPLSPALGASFGPRATELALSGGEDYELLFTAPGPLMEAAQAALGECGCPATVIGEMVDDENAGVTVLDQSGDELRLQKHGWDHFAAGKHGA